MSGQYARPQCCTSSCQACSTSTSRDAGGSTAMRGWRQQVVVAVRGRRRRVASRLAVACGHGDRAPSTGRLVDLGGRRVASGLSGLHMPNDRSSAVRGVLGRTGRLRRKASRMKRPLPAATSKRDGSLPIDLRRIFDNPAVRLNMISNLPMPALLIDRSGVVRLVNAQAAVLMGHTATGKRLSEWFAAIQGSSTDCGSSAHVEVLRAPSMATRAMRMSGWMRTVDSRWAAVDLRVERLAPIAIGGAHAEVIVVMRVRGPTMAPAARRGSELS